jgi:ERCC4-type nuclease
MVDAREPLDCIPRALADLGFEVEERRLPCGDYVLPNGVIVERKTVGGLNRSLVHGSFWPQLGKLRNTARAPYLLVEGPDLHAGRVPPRAVIGALLAVIGQGVPVLWSRDAFLTAHWIGLLANRAARLQPVRDRPAYAQRLRDPARTVREAVLAAVPGISTSRARALLDRFGTVAAVVAADENAWQTVPGIGPLQAERLRAAFH